MQPFDVSIVSKFLPIKWKPPLYNLESLFGKADSSRLGHSVEILLCIQPPLALKESPGIEYIFSKSKLLNAFKNDSKENSASPAYKKSKMPSTSATTSSFVEAVTW